VAQPITALRTLLEPVVAAHGVDLETVTVSRAGSRSVVRVVIDRDGGLDLDAVAEVSQSVNAALDADEEVIRGTFVLEVTTPGVDRPLTESRHWRRASGRLVKVTRKSGGSFVGRVVEAGPDAAVLVDSDSDVRSEVAYSEVSRAVMQVEFNSHADDAGEDVEELEESVEASS
jgi:ribosome maturation factor RimP